MPTRQQLIDALDRADAAGDEAAAREIAAMIQGSGAPAASSPAPTVASPALPPEEGFFDQVMNAMVGNMTTSKAMLQGVPGVGTWSDEAAGWLMSKIHGGDAKDHQKAYMAPVEAMPAGRRFAAELAGGVVGGAPLGGLGVLGGLGAATALGAVSGAGANQEDRMKGAAGGAVAGAIGGVLAPVIAGAGSAVGRRVANAYRAVAGKPTNPYIGRGGIKAQETLRKSVDQAADVGGPPPVADIPLVSQQPSISASFSVLAGGDDPAAKLVGAAKAIAKDDSALRAAAEPYQTKIGLAPLSAKTTPEEILSAAPERPFLGAPVPPFKVKSPVLDDLMENSPDVKRVLRELRGDIRFRGVPDDNPTKAHYIKTMLAKRMREAQKSGKKPEVAGRIGAVHEAWTEELNRLMPGYEDVSAGYAKEAATRAAQKEAAKVAGSEKKFVPVEPPGRTFASILPEFISGSLPGVQLRGTLATTAYAAQNAAKAAKGEQARKLVSILTEKDPKKIEMALRMLRKDLTGKPFRWPMTNQGLNVLQGLVRDEEAR